MKQKTALFAGTLSAFLLGFATGFVPSIGSAITNETWTFFRYTAEAAFFYSAIFFIFFRPKIAENTSKTAVFAAGFLVFFFESRALGFLVHDIGVMKESVFSTSFVSFLGIFAGFLPLFLAPFLKKLPAHTFLLPSLIATAGALKIAAGGVGEIEKGSLLISLQNGFLVFLGNAADHLSYTLLITVHPFIRAPFEGLIRFLSGDRAAMSLTVLFIMTPILFVLGHIFSRPDPALSGIDGMAQKRLRVAFFRKELFDQTFPIIISFIVIFFMIHIVNISLNPFFEPVPIPLRENEGEDFLRIPLSDKMGEFNDGKLRKYVYYYGDKQIMLIAIMKPDGSVGFALDECEICKPADWNKDAQGYAQKGENLICKYCMTPIAIRTVNQPGGCNPIPVTFRTADKEITIKLDDVISTFNKARKIDKKGTHL